MNIRLEVAGVKCYPPQHDVRHHAGVLAIVVAVDEGVAIITCYRIHVLLRGVDHPHARGEERMMMMRRGAWLVIDHRRRTDHHDRHRPNLLLLQGNAIIPTRMMMTRTRKNNHHNIPNPSNTPYHR